MSPNIPFHPEQASSIARSVDQLHFVITAITLFFTIVIFSTILYFMVKYRRRSRDERPGNIEGSVPLEITWTLIPTLICVGLYVWASSQYFANATAPDGAIEIFVTGKQWMWKVEHPEGQREINELHVPVGRPVKLTITSEDVIHDFFIPAFRVKKDALPGRYTSLWFTATETGKFHLFCAQYCGAFHAGMEGWVIVMERNEYEKWLNGAAGGETMEAAGQKIFQERGCATCHADNGAGRGPALRGIFGRPVRLAAGGSAAVDESYLREAILTPSAHLIAGYTPVMPAYQGQLTEEQVLDIIAYIRSLGNAPGSEGKAQP
jgi:cytochrome c oxidase subunit 2